MRTWALERDVKLIDPYLTWSMRIEDQELPLPTKEIDALVLDDYRLHSQVAVVPVRANQHDCVAH
jgi:hypothetical protein